MAEYSSEEQPLQNNLLAGFVDRYKGFSRAVATAILDHVDSVVLSRLSDDLNQFLALVHEVSLLCI